MAQSTCRLKLDRIDQSTPGATNEIRVTGHIRASNWFGSAEDAVRKLESNPPIQQSGNDIRIGTLTILNSAQHLDQL